MNHAALVRDAADRLAGSLVQLYAVAASQTRRGDGWVAIVTGASSNDLNGVVSDPGADIDSALVADLLAWFTDRDVPATWTITDDDEALGALLRSAGASPERTGYVCGRALDDELLAELGRRTKQRLGDHELIVTAVTTADDLDDWLDVADRCGWIVDERDRDARAALYTSLGLVATPLTHWLARLGGTAVGMALSYVADGCVDLCNLGVLPATQRRGIGSALANARLTDAAERGAAVITAELSPDGWELYRRLGFVSVPVRPDRQFYLPLRTPADA